MWCVRRGRGARSRGLSAFTSADIPKILALEPDLVLTFSDLQADIAAELIKRGVAVHAFNQRTLAEIFDMIRTVGALVGASARAELLANDLADGVAAARRRAAQNPRRPKVYFEEWDEPMISGIAWVSELIAAAGGDDVFADLSRHTIGQGSDRDGGRRHRRSARYHHRVVVRQEVSSRKSSRRGRALPRSPRSETAPCSRSSRRSFCSRAPRP